MQIYLPWTDVPVSSTRSLVNVLRHKSKITGIPYRELDEQVYRHNHSDVSTTCEFCGTEKIFRSFSEGYFCEYFVCIRRRTVNACHAVDHVKAAEYTEYIRNNLEFYKKNLLLKNVQDPFFDRNTLNISLNAFIGKRLGKSTDEVFVYAAICPYCKTEYKEKLLREKSRGYCGGRSCRNLLRYYEHDDIIDVGNVVSNYVEGIKSRLHNKQLMIQFVKSFNYEAVSHRIFFGFLRDTLKDCDDLPLKINSWLLYNNREKLNRLCWVEYPDIVFVSTPKGTQQHFKQWFKIGTDTPDEKLYDNSYYFSSCEICCKRNQHREFFTDTLLSRFCTVQCYHKSLSNTERFHPSLVNTPERRKAQSDRVKENIIAGKFTPCVTNSRCKSRVVVHLYDGRSYPCRSAWEATFALANQHLQYEKTRIPYVHPEGRSAVYITDFTDDTAKIIYEIKPKGSQNGEEYDAKVYAATKWCSENAYTYVIIDDDWYSEYFSTTKWQVDIKDQPFGDLILRRMNQFLNKKET